MAVLWALITSFLFLGLHCWRCAWALLRRTTAKPSSYRVGMGWGLSPGCLAVTLSGARLWAWSSRTTTSPHWPTDSAPASDSAPLLTWATHSAVVPESLSLWLLGRMSCVCPAGREAVVGPLSSCDLCWGGGRH